MDLFAFGDAFGFERAGSNTRGLRRYPPRHVERVIAESKGLRWPVKPSLPMVAMKGTHLRPRHHPLPNRHGSCGIGVCPKP